MQFEESEHSSGPESSQEPANPSDPTNLNLIFSEDVKDVLTYPTNLLMTKVVGDEKQAEYDFAISKVEKSVRKLHGRATRKKLKEKDTSSISAMLIGGKGLMKSIKEGIDAVSNLISTDTEEGSKLKSTCVRVKKQLTVEVDLLRLTHPTRRYAAGSNDKERDDLSRENIRNMKTRFIKVLEEVKGHLKELADEHSRVIYDACMQSISQDKEKVQECVSLIEEAFKDDEITKHKSWFFAARLVEEGQAFGPTVIGAASEIRKVIVEELTARSLRQDPGNRQFRVLDLFESLIANRKWFVLCNIWLKDILEKIQTQPELKFLKDALNASRPSETKDSAQGVKRKAADIN